jgi:hypothetical protein
MKIRTMLVTAVAAGIISGFCLAQDTREGIYGPDQLLADLRSNEPHARVGAVEQIRSNPAMLQNPNVQSALLDLLDLETHEGNARVREGERRRAENRHDNIGSSDDNAMYIDDLLGVIESFVNWHDPRQICLLAKEGAALDATDARESATRAQVVLPCLQQLSKSDFFMDRMKAARISVPLLASATGSLDSTTAEAMRQMVILALHDKRVEVQWEAVDSLERYGGSDMTPALKQLAESSPGPNATKDEIGVRKSAAKAIAAIQGRVAQQ